MPAWTLTTYEVVPATKTVRAILTRTADGDPVARHLDVPEPDGPAWTDADLCAALAAALPDGHTVTMPGAPTVEPEVVPTVEPEVVP